MMQVVIHVLKNLTPANPKIKGAQVEGSGRLQSVRLHDEGRLARPLCLFGQSRWIVVILMSYRIASGDQMVLRMDKHLSPLS